LIVLKRISERSHCILQRELLSAVHVLHEDVGQQVVKVNDRLKIWALVREKVWNSGYSASPFLVRDVFRRATPKEGKGAVID
jgi:hypothetical protein